MVKTKSQKVFWGKSYVCRRYRGKTGMGGRGELPPMVNRVNEEEIAGTFYENE